MSYLICIFLGFLFGLKSFNRLRSAYDKFERRYFASEDASRESIRSSYRDAVNDPYYWSRGSSRPKNWGKKGTVIYKDGVVEFSSED